MASSGRADPPESNGYRRDDVVVRASASQSVDLGFTSLSGVITKDCKKWYSQLSCLALSIKKEYSFTSLTRTAGGGKGDRVSRLSD